MLSIFCLSVTACNLNSPENSAQSSQFIESSETENSDEEYSSSSSFSDSEMDSEDDTSDSDSEENEESQDSESSSEEEEIDEELLRQQQTVDLAYCLDQSEYLDGYHTLTGTVTAIEDEYNANYGTITLYFAVEGREDYPLMCYRLTGEGAEIIGIGDLITVYGRIKNYQGIIEFDKNCLLLNYNSTKPDLSNDPYANISETEFYENYTPATDNTDAYYRSLHGFMSGSLTVPDQAPTISSYRPTHASRYVRNSEMLFSDDEKTYTVVNAYGQEVFEVYRDGAYITLEEVAAYVYAFGTYPKNYTTSKNTEPSDSVWGEYLRLNHTKFSGDTSRYPYEPVLPNISGCGGDLQYYEMDIGTTGTDCDPSYPCSIYNDGYSITRGAARIVYGKTDLNNNGEYEIGELHLFYTYNHYNDFQEYLNYQGGWGEMFGNITGGGSISSEYDYNPTDYVEISLEPLPTATTNTLSMAKYSKKNSVFYY